MVLDTSCPDWEDRIRAGRTLVPDLPLNTALADKAERIFKRLRIPDLPGTPTFADAGADWLIPVIRAVFGSMDVATGERGIQEIFALVPKKNIKSTGSGGVMVTAIIMNRRPRAELNFIAPTKEIARISFDQAAGMILADPELRKRYHLQDHIRTITDRLSGAKAKIVAADTEAVTGGKQTYTLIDEVHVFADREKANRIFAEIRGALASMRDGFLWMITTQSKAPPAGVFKRELEFARKVRDGKVKHPLLPVLYELPKDLQQDDGWKRPDRLQMVNPNLGRSVSLGFLKREIAKAELGDPAELQLIASQHANVEIGVGLANDGWAGAPLWEGGAEPGLTLEGLLDRCEVVTVGIDGGGLDDLFGVAVKGREKGTKRWLAWYHALISPQGMDRRKADAPRYLDFEKDGDLTVVDALPDDLAWLQDTVALIKDSGLLAMVGADPAGIGGVVDALAEIGVTQESGLLVGVAQGIRLMGAAKTIERKLADGTYRHSGSPMMAWCVGSVKVRQTSTAMLIERSASGFGKIDPFVAGLNAAHLMGLNPGIKTIAYSRGDMFR